MNKKMKKFGVRTSSKAFKRFDKANLLENIDYDFLTDVQNYWEKHYGKRINPIVHIAFMNLHKEKELRIIPSNIMWNEMIPFFNDMPIRPGYSDKNLYDKLVDTDQRPETVLKCVHGNYFNRDNEDINEKTAKKLLLSKKEDLIIKPSNMDNGRGIGKLHYRNGQIYYKGKNASMHRLKNALGKNFIVQTVIKQHPLMAEPHPASVNSLRMVTFRWNGTIKHLLTYARFGGGNNVKDHAIAGGVSVTVDDEGVLGTYGLDTHCIKHTHHPTTNYSFRDNLIQIPNYNEFKKFVVELHKNILHHDYVSWDIAVGYDGQPVFIEPNFRGTTWRYQLASRKPIFGDLTEEVLSYVSNELKNDGYRRSGKLSRKQILRKNRRLNRRIKQLHEQLNETKRELIKVNSELNYMRSSKSWKITKPLRNIMKGLK